MTDRYLLRSLVKLDSMRPRIPPYKEARLVVSDRIETLEAYVAKIIAHLRSKVGITCKEMDYVHELSDVLNDVPHAYGSVLRKAAFHCYVTDSKFAGLKQSRVENDDGTMFEEARHLSWRILPPGKWKFSEIRSHFLRLSKKWGRKKSDMGRLDFAQSLKPSETWIGKDEFQGYVIFIFRWTRAALLDRPMKGNACYILRRNWRKLSHLSKLELLRRYPKTVVRIIHHEGWKSRVRSQLKSDKI